MDNLLVQIRDRVTPEWFKFGQALGVKQEVLEECSKYPEDVSIVEMLDYWLRSSKSNPTWRNVGTALKQVGLKDLGDKILHVYRDGKLVI